MPLQAARFFPLRLSVFYLERQSVAPLPCGALAGFPPAAFRQEAANDPGADGDQIQKPGSHFASRLANIDLSPSMTFWASVRVWGQDLPHWRFEKPMRRGMSAQPRRA